MHGVVFSSGQVTAHAQVALILYQPSCTPTRGALNSSERPPRNQDRFCEPRFSALIYSGFTTPPAVDDAQIMDSNEIDATPRANGQQPSSEQGDSGEWTAIDSYRDWTPPGHDDEWIISSISRRFAHGEPAADVVESPTGEPVTRGDPHWYVTIKRDRFAPPRTVTTEYEHCVFPDTTELAAWFEEELAQ